MYHALIGTLEQVAIAAVDRDAARASSPPSTWSSPAWRASPGVTFFVDVMTGIPSIVAGLFVYTFLLLGLGMRPFGAAGSLALAVLMLPVVVRSSEEMLQAGPARPAGSLATPSGVPKWRTMLKVVLPTALSGLITSALLAVARVAGETAPLILLTGYVGRSTPTRSPASRPALPMIVWDQLGNAPATEVHQRTGRPGAGVQRLTLVLLMLVLNIVARLLARWPACEGPLSASIDVATPAPTVAPKAPADSQAHRRRRPQRVLHRFPGGRRGVGPDRAR